MTLKPYFYSDIKPCSNFLAVNRSSYSKEFQYFSQVKIF